MRLPLRMKRSSPSRMRAAMDSRVVMDLGKALAANAGAVPLDLSDLFSSSSPSLDPLHFTALCFLFFFVRPCPTLSQTSLPLFPQSSLHFLLVDNNSNPTNLLEPLPEQTLPTLTIPPALLIPLLALALIAARQQVRRTLCLSQYLSVLLIFLISPTANTTSRPQPPQARRSHSTDSTPSDKAKTRSKAKKSSIHADVIDRLDFTGVGPSNYPFGLKHFSPFLLLFA